MEITKINTFPFSGFEIIKQESIQENFNFLVRLEKDWIENKNRFSKQGEALYKVTLDHKLIAIGGINIDPFKNDSEIGRLRRFYVKKSHRKQKIGSCLIKHILSESKTHFTSIRLKTDNEIASKFYLTLGFKSLDKDVNASHCYFNIDL